MATAMVATPQDHLKARLDLLAQEKEVTKALDALAETRRALPMVEITTDYTFTTTDPSSDDLSATKTVTLRDLFEGRRQLIIYHFMFGPDDKEGCSSCTAVGDHVPTLDHLKSRDTSWVAVSRAPPHKLEEYKKKMGWTFPWVSSHNSPFNYDFHVTQDPAITPVLYNYKTHSDLLARGQPFFARGEQPGASCFVLGGGEAGGEEGKIYHTYSSYARGLENKIDTLAWLDMTKLGRQSKALFPRRYEYTAEQLGGSA